MLPVTLWVHRAIVFVVLAIFHFWSPLDALNKLAPIDKVTVLHDVRYGDGPHHTLDIYLPKQANATMPVVVYFFGSAWFTGSKDWYQFIGVGLAETGVIVAMPDYRAYPDVPSPGFMDDAAAATVWVRSHIATFGGDPRRVFLAGHSSGAHIAALLALDPEYLRSVNMTPGDICAVVGVSGPYDYEAPRSVPKYLAEYEQVFGDPSHWASVSPIRYATKHAPPMLLMAGTDDRGVDPDHSVRLATRLQSVGAHADAILYPGLNHQGMVLAFSDMLDFLAPVRADIRRFVAAQGTCLRDERTNPLRNVNPG
ncbi:MAG TPA: alpha/beta hydrolase [Acetobacteraceae bacterium]|jgi:acetyl esterase/lipase|nr:alpha/beta hydrolase [Acetobacteraceae bacterium]